MTAPAHATSETRYGDDGIAIPGTYAISVVSLGMWGAGGKPMPTVRSAVCNVCSDWASCLWMAGETTTDGDDLFDVRVSRRLLVVVYACPEHSQQVSDRLVDEFGSVSTTYDSDELADAVTKDLYVRFHT